MKTKLIKELIARDARRVRSGQTIVEVLEALLDNIEELEREVEELKKKCASVVPRDPLDWR